MSPTIRHLVSAALAFAVVGLGGLGAAAAQPMPPGTPPGPPPLPSRVGLELGFGLYGGEINCEDNAGDFCDGVTEAGGIDLHATYMFRPHLGITLDIWPMAHTENNWTFVHTVVTVGAKWRPLPILSLTAGVGSAQATLRYDGIIDLESRSESAPAVFLSAGVDVVRGRRFAIDVGARVGAGFYGEDKNGDGDPDIVGRNVGVGVGFTWF
jgi:hypothetical protein